MILDAIAMLPSQVQYFEYNESATKFGHFGAFIGFWKHNQSGSPVLNPFNIVNYDSRVALTRKLITFTTLETYILIVEYL